MGKSFLQIFDSSTYRGQFYRFSIWNLKVELFLYAHYQIHYIKAVETKIRDKTSFSGNLVFIGSQFFDYDSL